MRFLKRYYFVLILVFLVYAGEWNIRAQYFNLSYYEGCDLAELAKKLNAEHFLHIDVFSEARKGKDIDSVISKLIDSIYLEVSDILDIRLYSFDGAIVILPDNSFISDIIEQYSGNRINTPSFYFPSQNTIYISFADLNPGILAHEMAHAIISRYFVVAPSAKVQEVLTGYVEYSIRKATGTLPQAR
jgi:hypothetical protein